MNEHYAECSNCHWKYPDYLIDVSADDTLICDICILDISGYNTDKSSVKFAPEIAEDLKALAIIWRKEHPESGPAQKPK